MPTRYSLLLPIVPEIKPTLLRRAWRPFTSAFSASNPSASGTASLFFLHTGKTIPVLSLLFLIPLQPPGGLTLSGTGCTCRSLTGPGGPPGSFRYTATLHIFSVRVCVCACSHGRLCNPMDCSPPGRSVRGIFQARNTGAACHFLLHAIFLTQGCSPHLLYLLRRQAVLTTAPPGKPMQILCTLMCALLI